MVRLWERGRATEMVLGVVGLVAFPASAMLLGWLYLATHPAPGPIPFHGEPGVLLVVLILLVGCAVTVVLHGVTHALAMVAVRHRPRFHLETTPHLMLVTDREDALYSRGSFVTVALAPAVLLTAILVVGVVTGPFAGWLIVPAAFHLTASKMDVAYSLVVLRSPRGTRARITESGLELTEPVDDLVP